MKTNLAAAPSKRFAPLPSYLAMCRRIILGAGRRVAHADADDLAELVAFHDEVEHAMQIAIDGLRADGFTWESIGAALGITRQAACMRFGSHRRYPPEQEAS